MPFLLSLLLAISTVGPQPAAPDESVTVRLLVPEEASKALESSGIAAAADIEGHHLGWTEIEVPIDGTIEQTVATISESLGQPVLVEQKYPLLGPTDEPNFVDQWYHHNTGQTNGTADADIDSPTAWGKALGTGVVVAVIDSGVDMTHPDLSTQIWANNDPAGGGDGDGNGFVDDFRGWDFVDDDNNPTPIAGPNAAHGTEVAGVIAAASNGVGIVGVAPGSKVMVLRACDSTGCWSLQAAEAIYYAADNGADVINLSFGGLGEEDPLLEDAIAHARSRNVVVVAAAGNEHRNLDNLGPGQQFIPAGIPLSNIISVGASDDADNLAADFSNYGPETVDLAAPGVDVFSTGIVSTAPYVFVSGTSFSSPMVAGAAAVLLSHDPGIGYQELIARLEGFADHPGGVAGLTGYGRLNIGRSVTLRFVDTAGSVFVESIDWLAERNITQGCNPPFNHRYCPQNSVSRGEMAVFLSRAFHLPTTSTNFFDDDNGEFYEAAANNLAAAGLTVGCGTRRYCGGDDIRRDEMAAMLARATHIPNSTTDFFLDDEGSVFENAINKIAAAGITLGCNPPTNNRYCPQDLVTRGQMAAFIKRLWGRPRQSCPLRRLGDTSPNVASLRGRKQPSFLPQRTNERWGSRRSREGACRRDTSQGTTEGRFYDSAVRICLVAPNDALYDPRARVSRFVLERAGHEVTLVMPGSGPNERGVVQVDAGRPSLFRRLSGTSPEKRSTHLTEALALAAAATTSMLYIPTDPRALEAAIKAARATGGAVVRSPKMPPAGELDLIDLAPTHPDLASPVAGLGRFHTPNDDRAPYHPEPGRHASRKVVLCFRKSEINPGKYLEEGLRRSGAEVRLETEAIDLSEVDPSTDFIIFVEGPYPALDVKGETPVPVLFWFHHGEHHLHANTRLADRYHADAVLMAHSWHLAPWLQAPVHRFPFGMATELLDPSRRLIERRYDVAMVGAKIRGGGPYGRRQQLVAELEAERPASTLGFREQVSAQEMATLYGNARIVINEGGTRHYPITMRVLEAVGSGAVLLSDRLPGMEMLLDEGSQYALLGEDVAADVARLLDDMEVLQATADSALARATGLHTYDHRVDELFEIAAATEKRVINPTIFDSTLAAVIDRDVEVQRVAQLGAPELTTQLRSREIWDAATLSPNRLEPAKMETVAIRGDDLAGLDDLLRSARRYIYVEGRAEGLTDFLDREAPQASVEERDGVLRVDLMAPSYRIMPFEVRDS